MARSRKSKKAADKPEDSVDPKTEQLEETVEATTEDTADASEGMLSDASEEVFVAEDTASSDETVQADDADAETDADEPAAEAAESEMTEADDAAEQEADTPSDEAESSELGDDTLVSEDAADEAADENLAGLEETSDGSDETSLVEEDASDAAEETAEQPKDPEPEPVAAREPVASAPVQQQGGGFWPAIFGGVVAALIGFIVGRGDTLDAFLPASMQRQAVDLSALEAETAELADVNAALQERLEALETAEPVSVEAFDATALTDGLNNLDSAIALLNESLTTLSDRVTAVEDRPVEVAPQENVASSEEIVALQAAIDAQQSEIAALSARAAEAEEIAATEARQILARAALAGVVFAVNTGEPFSPALQDLEESAVVEVPDPLRAAAETGVPTMPMLQESFPEAARAGLAAARAEVPESDAQGLTGFLRRQLSARSVVPREGDDPDAVLSRAEAALRDGDLGAALIEIDALPDASKDAMSDWLEAAQARKAAQDAAGALADSLNSN